MDLNERFAETHRRLLAHVAAQCRDPHAPAAAALLSPEGEVRLMAVNRLPAGVDDDPRRWSRPQRYLYVELAPRALIFEAVRTGVRTAGAYLVATHFPAAEDARAIIQAGFRAIACPAPELDDVLEREFYASAQRMLYEAAVQVHYLEDVVA
ncbi:MAG: hypothetical protein JSR73_08115 [Proteobacteria bacterium]|nr:hypothetical protein [Pseudomonadota bacterium]